MCAVTVMAVLVAVAAMEVHSQCITIKDVVSTPIVPDFSGISHLAAELYHQLDTRGNFFFSPHSIWLALSLTYLGARGNTEAQLSQALKLHDKVKALNTINYLKTIASERQEAGTKFTFNDANRIYVDDDLGLRQCVADRLHDLIQITDINGNRSVAAKRINDFVSVTTEDRIRQVVSPSALQDAFMVVVNAVYFKGNWTNQFQASATRPMDFKVTPNSPPQSVNMMSQEASLMYGKSEELGAHVLELPYTGDKISMFVLLPEKEGEAGWTRMVNGLSGPALQRVVDRSRLSKQLVFLMLPRFKAEKTLESEMIVGLQHMGINDLFDSRLVDLSDFNPQLVVSKIVHKALVEVDEEGTEAAAVTAIILGTKISPHIIPFHCNRPFLYIIVDLETTSLLFMGSYRDPSS